MPFSACYAVAIRSDLLSLKREQVLCLARHGLQLSGAVAVHQVLRLPGAVPDHVLQLPVVVDVRVLRLSGAVAVQVLRLPGPVAVHVLRLSGAVAVHVLRLPGAVAAVATAGSRTKGVEFAPCVYASFYTSDIVSYTYKLSCGLLGMLHTFFFSTCMVYCSYIHHKFSFCVKMTSPARKTVHAK